MSLYVQKFGGSSVADAEKLLHVAHIIKNTYEKGTRVIVVLSAQGDATDLLLRAAREVNGTPSSRELDALLATGEQASVALCAMALHRLGVPAVSLCAWQAGIVTEGAHGEASVARIEHERIERELDAGRVVLVAGFQGVDEAGDITTLGRGGSDLSAVALAAAFRADLCQIYTDVDGVYTTDPRVCSTARRLERISFDDMLLLSRCGAQVLHDKSVALARSSGVTLEVRSCEEGSVGSIVCAETSGAGVTGVTRQRTEGLRLIPVTAVGCTLPSSGAIRAAASALERENITVCALTEGESHFSVYVSSQDADRALCAVHDALFDV